MVDVRRTTSSAVLVAILLAVILAPPSAAQPTPRRFEPSFLLPVDLAWTTVLESGPRHGPAYDSVRAYVALRNDSLTAVDLQTGEVDWTVEQELDHPPAAGDGVVVGASGSRFLGWRASDGFSLWSTDLGSAIASPPLWDTGWLVAATAAGEIVVLRGFDGKELWRRALGETGTVRPAISGGRLFVALADGRIVVLALGSGALLWERALPGRPQGILPLDALFVGSTDNLLYRLRLEDGAVDWYWRTGGDIVGTPIADLEHVYFNARDNVLRALDRRNGARRWRNVLAGRPTAGPLRVDSVVIVSGVSPNVDLFDAASGLPRGRYVAPSELAALPHVIPNAQPPSPSLILVTGTGEMVALASAAGPPTLTFGMPFEPLLPRPHEVGLADLVDWFPTSRPEAPAADPAMRPAPGLDGSLPPQATSPFPAPAR